ncbi:MAG TPA: hypothetical protein VH650_12725 [Gaiellaceae bacterium]
MPLGAGARHRARDRGVRSRRRVQRRDLRDRDVAFVNPTLALLSWFVLAPIGALINRRMPPDVREYFGHY